MRYNLKRENNDNSLCYQNNHISFLKAAISICSISALTKNISETVTLITGRYTKQEGKRINIIFLSHLAHSVKASLKQLIHSGTEIYFPRQTKPTVRPQVFIHLPVFTLQFFFLLWFSVNTIWLRILLKII